MQYHYDFRTERGVDMRAIADNLTVSFYDRRYDFTPNGQFTGANYYIGTLLEDSDTYRGEFCLHGGVEAWNVDRSNWKRFIAWLEGIDEMGEALK